MSAWLATVRGLWHSVAFRLALNYALLAVITVFALVAVFYLETVGTLRLATERQIQLSMQGLETRFLFGGQGAVTEAITSAVTDDKEGDSDLYWLEDADGQRLAGNLLRLPEGIVPNTRITEFLVHRAIGESFAQLLMHELPDGSLLVIGRDMQDQERLESMVGSATKAAVLAALLLVVIGTYVFRLELERRVSAIRRTTARVSAGQIAERIPQPAQDDEFARLNGDINQMLDRMENLMEGVRHVSNTIAHNLRTPLTRIMARLRAAQSPQHTPTQLRETISDTLADIEDVNIVFEKLLQIAEAESGSRRQGFLPVSLSALATDVVDLYAAVAEEQEATLTYMCGADGSGDALKVNGDPDLLAGAIANLVDNALKYAGVGADVSLRTLRSGDAVELIVEDNGPGIAAEDLSRVGTRFFRRYPGLPGFGLGLSSVFAVIRLHGGHYELAPARAGAARPGLRVRIILPVSHAEA
jgi:signal transduction histidine kinase